MTRCDEFHDAMAADAAGEIDPGTKAALAAHLDRCPACSLVRDRLSAALSGLGAEPAPEPGPLYWASFNGRLRERIAPAGAAARRRAGLMVAAALVAACGIGLVVTLRWPGRSADGPGGIVTAPMTTGDGAAAGVAAGAGGDADTVGGAGAGGGDAVAEARFEAALKTMLGDGGAKAGGDLEAILDDVAPGDPFALAGGLDEIDSVTNGGSGV
jgi:hypothetical protein